MSFLVQLQLGWSLGRPHYYHSSNTNRLLQLILLLQWLLLEHPLTDSLESMSKTHRAHTKKPFLSKDLKKVEKKRHQKNIFELFSLFPLYCEKAFSLLDIFLLLGSEREKSLSSFVPLAFSCDFNIDSHPSSNRCSSPLFWAKKIHYFSIASLGNVTLKIKTPSLYP